MPSTLRIWDLPTRLFHWALAACVLGAFITVKLGGLYMEWHVRFGLATLGLILFRVLWGLFGSRYARFSQFLRGPRAVAAYLRGGLRTAGHNPLGALSVIAMLLAFGLQAVSGLFASDDIMIQGPLYDRVDEGLASTLTSLHKANEWVLIALVGLHLLALLWYAGVKRRPLLRAMVTGDAPAGELPADAAPARDDLGMRLRALLIALCCAAVALWLLGLESAPAF
ncbi:cytochrome b/b6 domain-containing protein [Bordetella pseudohinzii]|uniref:Cytochrome B n=1 Tax=Bordetella pseudohinzii TaxID=1331258 RepID=A0A0J6EUY1_9BORD|nr:cytochrome b/b6 domain-containing protein [Bordetella pseudohinzii]ANY15771.1 cytochrome B [Bordetella pseudohinzii]KMM24235.1 cytochrome B561 [Bordetella pseudohinzii]KXA78734.1 cytochrome B [Bordetella pseudohinzii]KXA81338.1 cytochrome B [Bordetella pseudohinzii]CUI41986.1 Cytochrome b [Bordetella pseudohinzii]